MPNRVLRYLVPVDDKWHDFDLNGPVLFVAARRGFDTVEFWSLDTGKTPTTRFYKVFGTGHDIDDEEPKYVGSVLIAGGAGVWHLFEGRVV